MVNRKNVMSWCDDDVDDVDDVDASPSADAREICATPTLRREKTLGIRWSRVDAPRPRATRGSAVADAVADARGARVGASARIAVAVGIAAEDVATVADGRSRRRRSR